MDDFITRFEQQLLASRRPRLATRRGRVALGALVAIALAGGTATAAIAPWQPELGPQHPRQFTITDSPPPRAQLAELGVLRRPQTATDRGASVRQALQFFGNSVDGVRTNYVRALRSDSSGSDAVLVPVASYRLNLPSPPADAPPAVRQRMLPASDGLCLFVRDAIDGGAQSCSSLADLIAGRISGAMDRAGRALFYGLVPEGIYAVRLRIAGADSVTATVRDNFYAVESPLGSRGISVEGIDWLDSRGRPIRTLSGLTVASPNASTQRIFDCGDGHYVTVHKGVDPQQTCSER